MAPHRFRHAFHTLWGSTTFRLTLNYGLLAVASTLALVVFIYLQTVGAQQSQIYRQTLSRLHYLSAQHDYGGRDAIVGAMEASLSQPLVAEHELYLLLDEEGNKLFGNLDSVPDLPPADVWQSEILVVRNQAEFVAQLQLRELSDGSRLIVGRDMQSLEQLKGIIGRASMAAAMLAFFMVAVGTYIFRKELELRISAIRRTAAQISAGQFKERIPFSDRDDELSQLSRELNDMLDRVEALMQGVTHVTDTIAHNLRTPLMRILGRLRTARHPGTSPEDMARTIQFVIRETESLTLLFDKLLQIAEIEAGTQRRDFAVIKPATIVADVVDLYAALAEERGLVLALSVTSRAQMRGDADLLASAVANLVDNAIKFARHRVVVVVENHESNTLRISIRDDGPGIPDEFHEQIGKHFYRRHHEVEGHGLGLASVKAITRLHRGRLAMRNLNDGFVFSMSLPAL